MNRLNFFVSAMLTFVIGWGCSAYAQTTVTAKAKVFANTEYEKTIDVGVDVRPNNVVVVHSWAGVEGYDLYIQYNGNGNIIYVCNIINGEQQPKNLVENLVFKYEIVETGIEEFPTVNLFDFGDEEGVFYYESMAYIEDNTGRIVLFMQDVDDNEMPYIVTWDGLSTAIPGLKGNAVDGKCYTLNGVEAKGTSKGLRIINGKKILR